MLFQIRWKLWTNTQSYVLTSTPACVYTHTHKIKLKLLMKRCLISHISYKENNDVVKEWQRSLHLCHFQHQDMMEYFAGLLFHKFLMAVQCWVSLKMYPVPQCLSLVGCKLLVLNLDFQIHLQSTNHQAVIVSVMALQTTNFKGFHLRSKQYAVKHKLNNHEMYKQISYPCKKIAIHEDMGQNCIFKSS